MNRPHGRTKYVVEKCRCQVCREATRVYERERQRHLALVRWGAAEPRLVDATPAREHLAMLAEHGIGWKRAGELAGVSKTVCARLRGMDSSRPARRVRPDTLAKILAVQPTPANARPGARVTAQGTGRKLRSLVAIGWTQTELASRIGVSVSNFRRPLLCEPADLVFAGTWCAVDAVWRELCMTPGPSRQAARRAAGYGWAPPLAWDDIDDPDDVADSGVAGRVTMSLQVGDLTAVGVPLADAVRQIAASTGRTQEQVGNALSVERRRRGVAS